MVTPVQRRAWVAWVRKAFQLSTLAACRATRGPALDHHVPEPQSPAGGAAGAVA